MPVEGGNWYLASRIRKEAAHKETYSHTQYIMRQTFHASPYEYVVREGDTLYEIAQRYLKDGSRYMEILFYQR